MTTSSSTRRETGPVTGRGAARRADLLAAARRVFERLGYADARVADIVDEAGVAQGTFYIYFDSKDAAFREVAQDVSAQMLARLDDVAAPPDTPAYDRVEAAMRRFVAAYRPHARILAVLEQVAAFAPEHKRSRLAMREAFVARAARGIARQQAEGIADPDVDAELTADVLGTMVDHTCYLWLALDKPYDEDALIAVLTDIWARAVGIARPERRAKGTAP